MDSFTPISPALIRSALIRRLSASLLMLFNVARSPGISGLAPR
jgi:hypothetical protein